MKNVISTNMKNNNHQNEVVFSNRNNTDFSNLMNYFWNYMDVSTDNMFKSDLEPKIQVEEEKDLIKVIAEVPGIDENKLDLKISSDGYLSISGEKENSSSMEGKDSYFSEISYGMFKRTIPLPWDLDYDKAIADYSNGVLNISIPKTQIEKQKFKKINLRTTDKN